MCSSSQTALKQERKPCFTFVPFFFFFTIEEAGVVSADKEICPNYTAPLGRPGEEIRPKLPVRKKEDFSQLVPLSLCLSQTEPML